MILGVRSTGRKRIGLLDALRKHRLRNTSSNIIFENNTVVSTEAGVIPHGNSILFYG